MTRRTRAEREALTDAIDAIRHRTGWIHHVTASRLGLSRRTLARYSERTSRPSEKRALAMLGLVTDLPADLYTQLADALEVPPAQRPPLFVPVATNVLRAEDDPAEATSMTLMLYTAAEANGVHPAAARKIALAVLDHATERALDVPTARALALAVAKGREGIVTRPT
jgi:transcriptional regulator with XRE-family HTH domain